ncbi:MAG: M28 family peptidase, partial [Solirubrobacteraceae bacterium]
MSETSDQQESAVGWRGRAREEAGLDRGAPADEEAGLDRGAPAGEEAGFDRSSLEGVLREVVEALAAIERPPCSPGERQAAEWLAERLRTLSGVDVALEDEPSWGTFPPTATGLGALGVLAATLVLRGRPGLGSLLAAGTFAGIVDEAQNGPRVLRRSVRRRRSTVNLIARVGQRRGDEARADDEARRGEQARRGDERQGSAGEGGERRIDTLVVLAHHDAPQTGLLFDQTLQRRLYELAPRLFERIKSPLPQWWIGLAGPLCTIVAAGRRRRGAAFAGLAIGALGTAIVADVWRSQTVAGANDNLSGVAALVALAELLHRTPPPGLRVLLVSCGAEETLQDGVRAFIARHRRELAPESTCFVNLDTVGSPHL